MYTYRGWLDQGWLLARVHLSPHPSVTRLAGRTPGPHPMNLMLDTGARYTVLPEDALVGLGIPPSGTTPVRTSLHQVANQSVYSVVIALEFDDPSGNPVRGDFFIDAIGRPRPQGASGLPYEGLLGLDVLKQVRLLYDGPARSHEISCDQLPPPPSLGRS